METRQKIPPTLPLPKEGNIPLFVKKEGLGEILSFALLLMHSLVTLSELNGRYLLLKNIIFDVMELTIRIIHKPCTL